MTLPSEIDLPDWNDWEMVRLIHNPIAKRIVLVVRSREGCPRRIQIYLKGEGKKRFTRLDSLDPQLHIDDVLSASDSTSLFINTWRKSSEVFPISPDAVTSESGKLSLAGPGVNWNGLYAFDLANESLVTLPTPWIKQNPKVLKVWICLLLGLRSEVRQLTVVAGIKEAENNYAASCRYVIALINMDTGELNEIERTSFPVVPALM